MVKWGLGHYDRALRTSGQRHKGLASNRRLFCWANHDPVVSLHSQCTFELISQLLLWVSLFQKKNPKHPFSKHLEYPFTSPECDINVIGVAKHRQWHIVLQPHQTVKVSSLFQETESEAFLCMSPGCAVVLTADDDRYFQKPPAEQFISLSSTCTALLNNAQWRKTPKARCSDAQLCIYEGLITATAPLFIRPLHVFMFYTPCRKSRHLSQQSFHSASL